MEKQKDQILEKLSKMSPEQLDTLKCEKLVELKDALKQKYLYKDKLLIGKRAKEKEMLEAGLKESQIERGLRRDEELFTLRQLVSESGYLVKKLKLEIDILSDMFWRTKA